ncbi:adenylate/guanylate cyclase domain-containing protein [Usitatibacter palustris]|nr:adenylate/guanylate cyclase domain-containing protein [Usitatibacter palustris]
MPRPAESLFADGERLAFDAQMRLLREYFPRPIADDVVLIGTDDETEQVFTEPIALWHRHFARVFHGLAKARPAAVGVDVVLPERSFDAIMPGIDRALMRGLFDIKRSTVLVYVQGVNSTGELVPVQENFRGIVGPENLGIDRQFNDPDSVSRRFSERELAASSGAVPTLAGQILRGLGRPVEEGYIDFSVGHPLVRYIPIQQVAEWSDAGDEAKLKAAFGGRIVLIGSLIGTTDRWIFPVKLIELPDEAKRSAQITEAARRLQLSQPGVVIHLQVLRSHLANGLLKPVPEWIRWILCAVAALAVLIHWRPRTVALAFVGIPLALLAASMATVRSAQVLLPIASVVLCFWTALVARGIFDAAEAVVERLRLQRSFAGQVSPAVMKEMLHGDLAPGLSGQLADICVLFSDVRDFTTLSEKMPPQIVTTVLQRYFDRMVHAVHRYDGTVDKFIGDGMMVLFGAPRKSPDPCGDAVQCALAMMAELDALNVEFERDGLPTLSIGIGVNYGSVTVGNIGSSERHNYSAIGDAVNVAARIEGLTKELGRKILITESVVSRIEPERFHFDPLGTHGVKGHSPVKVWGIRTMRVAPAAA